MYKLDIGPGLTKYFMSWAEARSYCKAIGWSTKKLRPVH